MNEGRLEYLEQRIERWQEKHPPKTWAEVESHGPGGVLIPSPELRMPVVRAGDLTPKSLPKEPEPVTEHEIREARVLEWYSHRPVRNFFRKIGDKFFE